MGAATKRIGKYEIQEIIGRGGMGVVYKAVQVSLNRIVAIKTLPSQPDQNQVFIDRLKKEANILAKLQHPNIVYIIDIIRHEDDDYLVMEFIAGKTLAQLLKEQPQNRFEPLQATTIVHDIASALSHAHKHNIIHRDIKPANIMITHEGVVKVTDFGVARLTSSVQMTQTGLIAGTPKYMSPEQIRGEKDLDGRSDLYCLGIVFYEMLTGQAPFAGLSQYDVLVKQVKEDPVPPTKVMGNTSLADYEDIIIKCIAKEKTDRYQTADELIMALDAISDKQHKPFVLNDFDRSEDDKTRLVRPPVKAKPSKRYGIAIALLLMAIVGLATYILWPRVQTEFATKESVEPTVPKIHKTEKPAGATASSKGQAQTVEPPETDNLLDRLNAAKPLIKQRPKEAPVKKPAPQLPPGREPVQKPTPKAPEMREPVDVPVPKVQKSKLLPKSTVLPTPSQPYAIKRHFSIKARFDATLSNSSIDTDRIHAFLEENVLVQTTSSTDYDIYFLMDEIKDGVEVRFLSKIQSHSKGGASIVSLPFENIPSILSRMDTIIKREYCFKILHSLENTKTNLSDIQIALVIQGGQTDRLRVGQKIDICLSANRLSHGMLFGVDLEGVYLIPPGPGKIAAKMTATGRTCVRDLEVAADTGTEMLFAIGAPDERTLSGVLASAGGHVLQYEWAYSGPLKSSAVHFCERLHGALTEEFAGNWSAETQLISTQR